MEDTYYLNRRKRTTNVVKKRRRKVYQVEFQGKKKKKGPFREKSNRHTVHTDHLRRLRPEISKWQQKKTLAVSTASIKCTLSLGNRRKGYNTYFIPPFTRDLSFDAQGCGQAFVILKHNAGLMVLWCIWWHSQSTSERSCWELVVREHDGRLLGVRNKASIPKSLDLTCI